MSSKETNILEMTFPKAKQVLHDLNTYQIEIELQNEELRQAQKKLFDTQKKFTDLYDFLPVGYLTISCKGMIVEANLTASRMLGFTRGKLLKLPFSTFILPEYQDSYYRCRKELLKSETTQDCELRLMRKDGSRFDALMRSSIKIDIDGTSGQFRIVITDITKRKQAEAEREKLIVKLQKALNEIRTLRGIIPICSYCKNIRDDTGAWDKIEAYIMEHTNAKFTHGVCPKCYKNELCKFKKKN